MVDDEQLAAGAAVSNARQDVALVRRLAVRGEVGAADLHAAEWRLELALRALDRVRAVSRLPGLFDDANWPPPDAA